MKDYTVEIEKKLLFEKKANVYLIFRLFKYVFSSAKGICFCFLGATVVLSFLNPILAMIWKKYIDQANTFDGRTETIIHLVILVLAYYIIRFILNLLWRYTNTFEEIERLDIVQRNRLQEKLNTKIYSKISKLFPEYMEIPLFNDIVDRVFAFSGDAMQRDIMIKGYTILSRMISVVLISWSLFIFSPTLCFLVVLAPIPSLYTSFIGSKIVYKFKCDNTSLLREANYYQDLLIKDAVKEIATLSLFDFFYDKWYSTINAYAKNERRALSKTFIITGVNVTINNSVYIFGNIMAIILLTQQKITVGELSAVLSLITYLINDTSSMLTALGDFLSRKEECANFFRLLDLEEQKDEGARLEKIKNISLNNVSYRYPLSKKYVLKDINITIHEGEKIALVGKNGAGKSTFVKLITGMLRPSYGMVTFNGVECYGVNYKDWQNCMSAVFQKPARYHTFSVGENVRMGDVSKDDKCEVKKALFEAGISDIEQEQLLGKEIGGSELSGGEWQKLAIARCFYRNRDFVILDEPTGNLDALSEAEIFEKYLALATDKTVLFVTHRISAASLADRIIVFSEGCIVEDGTHEELMKKNGEYSKLFYSQAKWYNR